MADSPVRFDKKNEAGSLVLPAFLWLKDLEVSRNSSYLSPLVKILTLENTKKNKFSFGVLLAYSYLCQWYEE